MNNGEKTVVITGAVKGLGRSLALRFAAEGCEIIGLYRADTESARRLEEEFQAKGLRGTFIRQDITENGSWREFDEIIENAGSRHFVLIANASSPFVPKPLHLSDWSEFAELLDVNLKGTLNVFKRLLPAMVRSREGTVIGVLTSALGNPPKGFSAYLAAKSALDGLIKCAAAEYAARGIRFFSVSPGFMETALTDAWSAHLKALMTGDREHVSQPDAIAAAICELAASAETSGQGENYPLGKI